MQYQEGVFRREVIRRRFVYWIACTAAAKGEGEKEESEKPEGEKPEEDEEEEQCAVCRVELEKGEDAATLPCGHAYHEGCVLAWLERAKSCPVCGSELEEGEE